MITWSNVTYTISNKQSPTYDFQLFYQSKKQLANELSKHQSLVEEQLGVKLTVSYNAKERKLYLQVQTNRVYDKEVLINKIIDCYENSFSKPEKFLDHIEEISLHGDDTENYMKVIVKPGALSEVFRVLEGRGNKLDLEAKKYHVKRGDSFITLTPKYGSKTIEDLLALKDTLLLTRDEFLDECKAIKLGTSLTEKTPKKNLRKPAQAVSNFINLPLSNPTIASKLFQGNFNAAANPNTLWFTKRTLPKRPNPSAIVDLIDDKPDDSVMMEEFRSQLLADTDLISPEDFKAVQTVQAEQGLNKRRAEETEASQAYKVQKTSENHQADQPNNNWEVEEFIFHSIYSHDKTC